MAEQITHDVVKEAQSMGAQSPIDATATSPNSAAGDGEASNSTAHPNPSEPLQSPPTNAPSANAPTSDATQTSEKADGESDAVSYSGIPSQCSTNAPQPLANQDASDVVANEDAEHLVNGDAGDTASLEDAASQQAIADASGGSDTDISRPGSVDPLKERPGGHLRSNSVKKPASFKSVSVTKNFLAKSAVSTPVARPGEKAAPVGQTNASALLSAKPRLVAKSGSGLGNVPRAVAKVNGAGPGPDASKVWNKNQPVPTPPPKQFTDEELKQQYGIHLATRLQSDEASKEAKWADIDEDEDDWAPDTVQWMDGTKSTVAAVENEPPPPPPPAPEEAIPTPRKETPPVEAVRPPPAPTASTQPTISTGGTKTILKPGSHSQGSSSKSGSLGKGSSDKPTLVAKPSTAAPKSPWASLPPVEKVSPIQINAPAQQPPSTRFSQRDSHGYDTMPPPLTPAKEIAPDDFNRSWRDDRGNRELFNSHNGRYEPVNEMRRGSIRDNSFRQQPSVLQRPSHDGPAEPSAAFQTSRNSAEGPTWGRRRNSSNVSGGSGRRMSIDRRAPDMPPMPANTQRRGSHSVNGTDAGIPGTQRQTGPPPKALHSDLPNSVPEQHATMTQISSPSTSQAQPASPFESVGSSSVNQDVVVQAAPTPIETAVEVQKRMMQEKIERARLGKQKEREREEKEEAERKERLRKKLEAMGLADDHKSKSHSKDLPIARSAERSPQKDKAVPVPIQSPPKPPVPTSEGEVAQYGMMKVHQPHPVKKPYQSDPPLKPSRGTETAKSFPSPVKAAAEVQPQPAVQPTQPPSTFTREADNRNKLPAEQSQALAQQSEAGPPGLKPTQPPPAWTSSLPPQQSRPWSSNVSSNVWGPPQAKDRALGNGTFDSAYNPTQPRAGPTQQLPPQPQSTQTAPLSLSSALKPQPSQSQTASNQPFSQQATYKQVGAATPQNNSTSKPRLIAPPPTMGWGNFHAHIRRDDQDMALKSRQDFERMGGETFRPEIRETYTDQRGKSQTTLHTKVAGNPTAADTTKPGVSHPVAAAELKPKDEVSKPVHEAVVSQTTGSQAAHLATAQASRSSRFFPRPSETTAQSSTNSNKQDSPPPPETESHPAFTSNSDHPVVKMPKPSPRVRLPPPVTESALPSAAPVSMPSHTQRLGAQPISQNPEWQVRFNNLFGKESVAVPTSVSKGPTPASSGSGKQGSLAIAASSKAPLDVRQSTAAATVSLPNSVVAKKTFVDDGSNESVTRSMAEEILLEEREFGSLPIVRLSKVPHLAANEPPVLRE
ncbi:hypothetical protein BDV95DRAFT_592763 [Massariosphaeria phaeospora]|uniref:Uncharacterized protein n=1 Tax=Massariosphaeria phaeospora TaxID=100035 RepID=A0A7C8MEJ4_9PLEO|nr:hypothetical protein BDV95DRAFT_592763 [Massariosphaeria phaeospora]